MKLAPLSCPALQIDLGGGHVIEFVMAPNLHWPDTMFSFDHATNVMYTCEQPGSGLVGWESWYTENPGWLRFG